MKRIVILGNSGSGKSTLARWLAGQAGVPVLDLDSVFWEPGRVAVPRSPEAAAAEVDSFCGATAGWVVEGCYGSLVRVALRHRPGLVLLDPGVDSCVAHCRSRPWEPHKYATAEEQNSRLDLLLDWVREYPTRPGEMGFADHWSCFQDYPGSKLHLTDVPVLDPESKSEGAGADRMLEGLLDWLRPGLAGGVGGSGGWGARESPESQNG